MLFMLSASTKSLPTRRVMPNLFDAVEADRLKEEGMARAVEWTNKELFELAHQIALNLAKRSGRVTADEVYEAMLIRGIDPKPLGNAWGSVFRKGFTFTGEWRKSTRTTNHGRYVRVWRLKS